QHTVDTANFLLFTQLYTIVRQTRFTRTVLARSLFNLTLGINRANARLQEQVCALATAQLELRTQISCHFLSPTFLKTSVIRDVFSADDNRCEGSESHQ